MQQPPFEIRNLAELVDALSVAAQVEHVVLVEYLYAAFSCRHTWDASVPAAVQMTSWEAARELYAWRLRLVGADCIAQVPEGVPASVTDSPWWLELVSTGFDPDGGCALLRGVLHAPLDGAVGPRPWRMALEPTTSPVARPMPVDAMGVRAGR